MHGETQHIFYQPLPLHRSLPLSLSLSHTHTHTIMEALSSLPSVTDEDVDKLMERLSTQFGDLDLKNLFLSSPSKQSNDYGDDDDDNDGVGITTSSTCLSSSSSLEESESSSAEEEPTPEQLELWQATQFEKGKYKKMASASRSSTTNSPYGQQQQYRQKESSIHEDDWEQIVSLPDLQGQTSHFFFSPSSDTCTATTNVGGLDQQDVDKLDDDDDNDKAAFMNVSMLEHQTQLREGDDDSVVFVSSPSNLQQKASPVILSPTNGIPPPTKRFDLHDLCQVMPEILGGDHGLPNKGGATSRKSWKRLYSSYEGDGLSLRALWYELRGYAGPTVLLLECIPSKIYGPRSCHQKNSNDPTSNKSSHSATSTTTVGFFTMDTWNEPSPSSISSHKSTFFGKNDDCFLFGIDQDRQEDGKEVGVKVIRPRSRASSAALGASGGGPGSPYHGSRDGGFMYYRNGKNGKATDGAIHGIGVGGNANQPRLHLTESLEGCRALPYDTMFEDGDILSPKTTKVPTTTTCNDIDQYDTENVTDTFPLYYFDVVGMEVWGVGGRTWIEEALEARERVRVIAASQLRKRQTVKDKHVVYQDLKSGLMSTSLPTSQGATSFFDPYYPGPSAGGRCDV